VKTETTRTEKKSKVWQVVSNIGIIVALSLGVIQVVEWWNNREPKLELFVPQFSTGRDPNSNILALNMLVRISNSHAKNAYLFPETMSIEVKNNSTWHKTHIAWISDRTYLVFADISPYEQTVWGMNEVPILKRFENAVISYDNPLSRYITIVHENESVLQNVDGIRIQVRDCHMKLYKMEVDLAEQSKYDPERKQQSPQ
jgi:hypothetical protein